MLDMVAFVSLWVGLMAGAGLIINAIHPESYNDMIDDLGIINVLLIGPVIWLAVFGTMIILWPFREKDQK